MRECLGPGSYMHIPSLEAAPSKWKARKTSSICTGFSMGQRLWEREARGCLIILGSRTYIYIYIYMYVCMFWWLTGVESNKKIRLEAIARLVIKLHQQEHMTYPDEYTAGERVRVYICFSLSIAFVSKEKQSAFKTIQPSTILDDGVRLFLI